MTIEPFRPVIRQGRLYGRGSCDTKGSMAAMLVALARLAHERPPGMPTVMMSCPVDEESGFTGARALARLWSEETLAGGSTLFPRRPDAVVVGEPTGLDVVVAHKGGVRWTCQTLGRAAHSSNPAAGESAIYLMARILPIFEQYQAQAVGEVVSHPLCGGATLSVGTIHGGVSVNTVPDRCAIEIDRRVPPGEDTRAAYNHVLEYFAREGGFDFPAEHGEPTFDLPALSDADNGPLAARLSAAVTEVVGRCARVGAAYATHASVYAASGAASVVFGPGFIEQAHTEDEWLPLDQLEQAAEALYRFVLSG
jgi:acetylornithine deacetylase